MDEFYTEAAKRNERVMFEIWHDRFVKEYNRSHQARNDRTLNMGIPENHWDTWFQNDCVPLWVKTGNRNIGFVSPQQLTIGLGEENAKQIEIISDVYIDKKFRGRGLLQACLMEQRELGRQAILIDEAKLLANAGYYVALGFKFLMRWPEQDLLIVSPERLIDDRMWTKFVPD